MVYKSLISMLLIGILLASVASADATISTTDIQFKKIGEGIGDFFFKIKSAFAFDDSTKLSLFEQRERTLNQRQQEWLSLQSNIVEDDKEETHAEIEEVKQKILAEHAKMFDEINQIEMRASIRGDAEDAEKARTLIEQFSSSHITVGLNVLSTGTPLNATLTNTQVQNMINTTQEVTAEKAADIARAQGLSPDSVTTENRNGRSVFVVKGTDLDKTTNTAAQQEFELVVDKETGAVVSVRMFASASAGQTTTNNSIGTRSGSTSSTGASQASAQVSGTGTVVEKVTATETTENSAKSTAVMKTTGDSAKASASAYASS